MTYLNRRRFLAYGSASAAVKIMTGSKLQAFGLVEDESGYSHREDDKIRKLAKIAVDSAISAGATYADIRLTHTKNMDMSLGSRYPNRTESIGIGIRSLSQGYWGFASSPIWSETEAARLGKAATENAMANKSKSSIPIELSDLVSSASGSWTMPVQHNPFEIPFEEIADYLEGLFIFITRLEKVDRRTVRILGESQVQDKYFFSSNNQLVHQQLYNTSGLIQFNVLDPTTGQGSSIDIDCLTPAGMGIELLKNRSIRDYIREKHEEGLEEMQLSTLPVDVGRYTVLMNRSITASLASQSLGISTELDRALGYEANAGGTSYINSPDEMLGTLSLTSPMIEVTASRSQEGSVGRVEWDDEGVKPVSTQLIKGGKLVGLQAPREGYSWLKEYHAKNNSKFIATGSMNCESGIESPLVFSSDLRIEPDSKNSQSIEQLREGIKDGIEFKIGRISMDFQLSTGIGIGGSAFKVVNGKRVARIINSGTLFRTANLWKNVIAVGREEDMMRFGFSLKKGEPSQTCYHSVYSPHVVIKEMDIIDVTRKA